MEIVFIKVLVLLFLNIDSTTASNLCSDESFNQDTWCLEEDYEKKEPPRVWPTVVISRFNFEQLYKVDDFEETIDHKTRIRLMWRDPRINFQYQTKQKFLNGLDEVWVPKLSINGLMNMNNVFDAPGARMWITEPKMINNKKKSYVTYEFEAHVNPV